MRYVQVSLMLALLCCSCAAFADTEGKELRVIYPVSIVSQAEGYISLFQEHYPDISIISESTNGTSDLVTAVISNETGYDVILVPDYVSLEKALIPSHISWDIRFGHCEMVLSYTPECAYADIITPENWYEILARENVTIAMVKPDVDARGWRSLVTMKLADNYYKKPIFSTLVPGKTNISCQDSDPGAVISALDPLSSGNFMVLNTTTELVDSVKNGTVDYAWNYRGGAYQHGLSFTELPAEIDLSSADYQEEYWNVSVVTGSGVKHSPPIVFAASVPANAKNPDTGIIFIQLVISEKGAQVLEELGQIPIKPAEGVGDIPPEFSGLVTRLS